MGAEVGAAIQAPSRMAALKPAERHPPQNPEDCHPVRA
jgi:hypothetical protein